MSSERTRTDRILESYGYDQSNLIAILQEIQAEYKYLSEESLTLVAESTSSRSVPAPPVTSVNLSRFLTRFTIIWACPGRKRPPRTGCSPWKPWRASAPAVWPPS